MIHQDNLAKIVLCFEPIILRWVQVLEEAARVNDFSIVIPFRHGAKYALSALLSCRLAARDFDAEVIICLDGPSSQE